jgi:hypothetical protein
MQRLKWSHWGMSTANAEGISHGFHAGPAWKIQVQAYRLRKATCASAGPQWYTRLRVRTAGYGWSVPFNTDYCPTAAPGNTYQCQILGPATADYADGRIQISRLAETGLPSTSVPTGSPCNAARALASEWQYATAEAEGFIPNTDNLSQPPNTLAIGPSGRPGNEVSPWNWTLTYSFDEDYSWGPPQSDTGNQYDTGWMRGQVRFHDGPYLVTLNASVYTGTTDCGPDLDTGGHEWCTRNLEGAPNFIADPNYGAM